MPLLFPYVRVRHGHENHDHCMMPLTCPQLRPLVRSEGESRGEKGEGGELKAIRYFSKHVRETEYTESKRKRVSWSLRILVSKKERQAVSREGGAAGFANSGGKRRWIARRLDYAAAGVLTQRLVYLPSGPLEGTERSKKGGCRFLPRSGKAAITPGGRVDSKNFSPYTKIERKNKRGGKDIFFPVDKRAMGTKPDEVVARVESGLP